MSSPAAWSAQTEREFLETLRSRYEQKGYAFTIEPDRSKLPPFLGRYVPDAIAQKAGENIAIEVKRIQSPGVRSGLQQIRKLFEGQPDWQFHVIYAGSGPLQSVVIPSAPLDVLRSRLGEVRRLDEAGFPDAAFVMAWPLLEATLQAVSEVREGKPRTPGTVVQALATNGYISPATEQGLRELINLRNQIVHGDVMAHPSSEQVQFVASAIQEALIAATSDESPE